MQVRNTLAAVVACTLMPAMVSAASGGKNLGAVSGGERAEANRIIDERCLSCHNRGVIEKASAHQRDMAKVVKSMEGKGAALTDHEREVLQHFWRSKAFKGK